MRCGIPIVCLALSIGVAAAQLQSVAQLSLNLADKHGKSLESLKQYSWKSRTIFEKNGQAQSNRVESVRYDLDGGLQKTPIEPQTESKQKPKKLSKEQLALTAALRELLSGYSLDKPGAIVEFVGGATLTPDTPGVLRATAFGVVRTGDQMTLWIDTRSQEIERVRVITRLERDTVVLLTEHGKLVDGLQYVARRVARIPARKIAFTIENFDFARSP
jgi:hypothetical protein